MGYNLGIGQLEISITDEGLDSYIDISFKAEKHKNAPAYGEPTDFTNSRCPSYTSWHESMKFVGLKDLFFNKYTGILENHPGTVPLKKEHKKIIDKAYKLFYEKYPNVVAGYSSKIDLENGIFEDKRLGRRK